MILDKSGIFISVLMDVNWFLCTNLCTPYLWKICCFLDLISGGQDIIFSTGFPWIL